MHQKFNDALYDTSFEEFLITNCRKDKGVGFLFLIAESPMNRNMHYTLI